MLNQLRFTSINHGSNFTSPRRSVADIAALRIISMFSSVTRPLGIRFDIASQILMATLRGRLAPGERLVVKRISQEFGVSATPAREALLELANLGIVQIQPNRGAVVRSLGPAQLSEIYAVRALLEAEATRLACGKIPPDQLSPVIDETRQLMQAARTGRWSDATMQLDRSIHLLIAEHCGNERLRDEISRLDKLIHVARSLVRDATTHQLRAHQQHLTVLTALQNGSAAEAAAAMKSHIESAGCILAERRLHNSPGPDTLPATDQPRQLPIHC